jgi:hypothetical protein
MVDERADSVVEERAVGMVEERADMKKMIQP